ncbi:flagellar hook-basal body complex protein [Solirhodobacter olei]|uniref:flagellar hook protein FlgE n=1 Tax=Solirhodobacter olei TaxID=2493082 RepID=UPI0030C801CB
MTISSSLHAAVAGLNVNASALGAISDNIANSNTYGYKRTVTDFESLVTTGSASTASYSSGGVRAISSRAVDQTASLVSTQNPLDIAVNGRGMLPVTSAASVADGTAELPLMMTATGAFHTNSDGVLETTSGLALLGWPANADGTIDTFPRDTITGLQPVVIRPNQTAGDPTTKMTLGVNLPATATESTASGDTEPLSVEYYGNLGEAQQLNITFVPTIPATGASNEWTMTIKDSAQAGAVIGQYTLTFDDTRGAGGTLASVTTLSGGAYDAANGTLALTVAGGPITMTIGKVGDTNGLTQLSNTFAPTAITKDGSPVGNLTSATIDKNGLITASYDTGFTRVIYQVPVIDVPSPNGLTALDNQAYAVSPQSGSFFLWNAGQGPTGTISGYALASSNTDLAQELTNLIQTQRAYSSNAKVVQTVGLSPAIDTVLPVEIWFCTVPSWSLIFCSDCSATMALELVRIEDIGFPFAMRRFSPVWNGRVWRRFRRSDRYGGDRPAAPSCLDAGPLMDPES